MKSVQPVLFVFLLLIAQRAAAIIDASLQMQLGNPSDAIADTNNHNHYLIQRSVEAIDFSDNLGEPVWAAWDLTANDIGDVPRSSSFYTDTNLPPNFHRVTASDYNGVGAINFNRGHLCPSEDRTDTTNDNRSVFFMSNIMPQSAQSNQGVWNNFESYCRTLAATQELLIICGPSGFGTNTIPSGEAYIPSNVWKVVVAIPLGNGTALSRLSATNRIICISIPNVTNGLSSAWTNYVTSAKQIEQDTGLAFFTAIPNFIASVYRAKIDGTPSPVISNFSPTSGAIGDNVTITGTNFTTASSVWFNGASANFTVNSSNQITAAIPAGATTGIISVITAGGLATCAPNFFVSTLPIVSVIVGGAQSLTISWPAPSTGFVLQQNSNLTTTNWASVTNAVVVTNGLNQIILPFTISNNFFRLISP